MNDTPTLASAPHRAARPGTPVEHGGSVAPARQPGDPAKHYSDLALAAIRQVEAEIDKPLAEHTAANGFLRLLGRLGSLTAQWRMWGDTLAIRGEIDDLSERQLLELGIGRVARRERWLDGCETRLPMDYFEYHIGQR